MDSIIQDVVKKLSEILAKQSGLLINPLQAVTMGMELMNKYPSLSGSEKKVMLVKALNVISSGKDGIVGTNDDVIPKPVLDTLMKLIEGQLVHNLIDLVSDVSKGKFDIDKTSAVAKDTVDTCSGCFKFLMGKKGTKYQK